MLCLPKIFLSNALGKKKEIMKLNSIGLRVMEEKLLQTNKQTVVWCSLCADSKMIILARFSKHDATSKTTWEWRQNGVIWPFKDVATPFWRHSHVVFDVASCLLNLAIYKAHPIKQVSQQFGCQWCEDMNIIFNMSKYCFQQSTVSKLLWNWNRWTEKIWIQQGNTCVFHVLHFFTSLVKIWVF